MKSKNSKKILFLDPVSATQGLKPGVDGMVEKPDDLPLFKGNDGDSVRLADALMKRVSTLYVSEKVTDYQYYYFKQRVKESPAVTDIRLDGDVLVLILADGTEERVQPGNGAVLPQQDVIEHLPFYEKVWYWIKRHKAVAIGGGTVLLALIVLLLVKRH